MLNQKIEYEDEMKAEVVQLTVSLNTPDKEYTQIIAKKTFFEDQLSGSKEVNTHNPNDNITLPQHCSWVGHEYDCANPTTPPHHSFINHN